ncbi:MAG TPA: hypothetical protein VLJ76_02540 [Gaiellaceae bacterium]|nr:hypothetical protein [Gaiellaceae bacterium]
MRRARARAYAGFLRAATELAEASAACRPSLSRAERIELGAAVLRIGEADRAVGVALVSPRPEWLDDAARLLAAARASLAEAELTVARRRTLRLV